MKKNRFLAILLTFALSTVMLTACGGEKPSEPAENTEEAEELVLEGTPWEMSLGEVKADITVPETLEVETDVSTNVFRVYGADKAFEFSGFISDYPNMNNSTDFADMKAKVQKDGDLSNYTETEYSGLEAYYCTGMYYSGGYMVYCNLDFGNNENVIACEFRVLDAEGNIDKEKTPEEVLEVFFTDDVQAVLNSIAMM